VTALLVHPSAGLLCEVTFYWEQTRSRHLMELLLVKDAWGVSNTGSTAASAQKVTAIEVGRHRRGHGILWSCFMSGAVLEKVANSVQRARCGKCVLSHVRERVGLRWP